MQLLGVSNVSKLTPELVRDDHPCDPHFSHRPTLASTRGLATHRSLEAIVVDIIIYIAFTVSFFLVVAYFSCRFILSFQSKLHFKGFKIRLCSMTDDPNLW